MLRLLTLKSIEDIQCMIIEFDEEWTILKQKLNCWVDQNLWTSVSEEYLDAAIGCLKPHERKTAADLCVVLQGLMKKNKFELFDESSYRKLCISCLMYPRVNISLCLDSKTCIFYCKGCLVNRFVNPVFCPSHGVCNNEPIGSENWFLLAIGGHSYKLCDPENMFYRDAERVCNIFQHTAVCGIRPSNVRLCCQQRNNLTSDLVVSVLEDIVHEMNKANVRRPARGRLIVFYSGHGHSDGGLKLTQTEHLKPDQLKTALGQMECPADVLIFIDCCYAAKQDLSFDLILPSKTCGIQISSCSAREISKSGRAGDCHSKFTEALVSCLSSRPMSCQQNCQICEDDKKAIVDTGFIGLSFLKSYLDHQLPIEPTCKGEHFCKDIRLAYECHSEIVDHLVDFVDSRDSNDIITKSVYITEKDFEEVERQTTVDQLKEFKQLVLHKHAQYYVELPDNYSKPENYTLYSSWEKELEKFDDLSKLLKIKGIPTMKWVDGQST